MVFLGIFLEKWEKSGNSVFGTFENNVARYVLHFSNVLTRPCGDRIHPKQWRYPEMYQGRGSLSVEKEKKAPKMFLRKQVEVCLITLLHKNDFFGFS